MGWLGEGRTMRQAIREFNFDVAQATAILARLLKTNSVEPLRPVTLQNIADSETGDLDPMMQRYSTTGGQKHAAANFAQAASRAYDPDPGFVQDAFISTSFRPDTVSPEIEVEPKPAPKRSIFDPIKKIGDEVRASMEARLRVRTLRKEHSLPEPEREESPSARNSNTRPADPRSTNTNMRPADPRSTNSNMKPAESQGTNTNMKPAESQGTNTNMKPAEPPGANTNMKPAEPRSTNSNLRAFESNPRSTNSNLRQFSPRSTSSNIPAVTPLVEGGSFGPASSDSNWAPVGASKTDPLKPIPLANAPSQSFGGSSGLNAPSDHSVLAGFGQVSAEDLAGLAEQQPFTPGQSVLDTSDTLSPIRQDGTRSGSPKAFAPGTLPQPDFGNSKNAVQAFTSSGSHPILPNQVLHPGQPIPPVVQSDSDSSLSQAAHKGLHPRYQVRR